MPIAFAADNETPLYVVAGASWCPATRALWATTKNIPNAPMHVDVEKEPDCGHAKRAEAYPTTFVLMPDGNYEVSSVGNLDLASWTQKNAQVSAIAGSPSV
jgi:hypothetical protein